MHNTACSLRETKRNVINFWLVWSKFEEEANKSMSGLRWYHLMMYEYILSHCTNQVDRNGEELLWPCARRRGANPSTLLLAVACSRGWWSIHLSRHESAEALYYPFMIFFFFSSFALLAMSIVHYIYMHQHSVVMLRLNDLYAWGGSRPWSMNGWQWQSAKQHGPARADDATNQTSV